MTNATATASTTSNETVKTPAEPKDYQMVAISVPTDLAKTIEDGAKDAKVGAGVFVRRIVAKHFEYDITSFERSRRKGRVKFASEEEKLAAVKERAATVKALMERYNKGLISISDEEIEAAKASMKPRGKSKAKTATK